MSQQIAIVMSEVFLRRLTPALMPFVRREHDFRIVSIHRPINELLIYSRVESSWTDHRMVTRGDRGDAQAHLPTVIADTDYSYQASSVLVWTTAQWV